MRTRKSGRCSECRKNGPLEKRSLEKTVRGKKIPRKMVPGEMVFKIFYLTHKNVTVIFASKYRRFLLIGNGFVVKFWVFIDYATLK